MDKAYFLKLKGAVPKCGEPFYVQLTHPTDGSDVRLTTVFEKAKAFHDDYLTKTVWNWKEKYEAVEL